MSIMTSPDYIVYEIAPVNIRIFTCSKYSARKGATVHSSNVNDISHMFLPKKCVSAWLSISVDNAYQCICSYYFEAFSINLLYHVLI